MVRQMSYLDLRMHTGIWLVLAVLVEPEIISLLTYTVRTLPVTLQMIQQVTASDPPNKVASNMS